MADIQHTQESNQSSTNLQAPTSALLSHICDAARLPNHPQHQDACNAVASYVWDLFMGAEEATANQALYQVTHRFQAQEGGIRG